MRRSLSFLGLASLAILASTDFAPASAQTVQSGSYGSDIVITGAWRDLTTTYGAMANTTAWVANKSSGSIVVVFSPSTTAPDGGGTVLAPNAPPLFGSAAHVWVKALGGGSLPVSVGLGASSVGVSSLPALPSGSNTIGAVTISGTPTFICGSGCGGGSTISATASSTTPSYTAGAQALSLDLFGSLRTRVENGANVAIGATNDAAWNSGNGTVVGLLKTIANAALDTTTINTVGLDQSSPGTSNSTATKGFVVSGNSSYSASAWQPLNLTTDGRLKVSLSSATNIAPAALGAATTGANLVACQYNSGGVTFATAQTGAVQCDGAGRVIVAATPPTSASSTSTNVSAGTTSTQLLATNAARTGGNVVNDSTVVMYLKLSSGASSTSYDYFLSGSVSGVPAMFEIPPGWTGPIYAAWASASGTARVSERSQ